MQKTGAVVLIQRERRFPPLIWSVRLAGGSHPADVVMVPVKNVVIKGLVGPPPPLWSPRRIGAEGLHTFRHLSRAGCGGTIQRPLSAGARRQHPQLCWGVGVSSMKTAPAGRRGHGGRHGGEDGATAADT
jgi:hypothetical protein